MKKNTIAVGIFILAVSSVFSQVQEIPKFSSDAEKVAWIAAHPVDYQQVSGETLPVTNQTPEFTTQADKDAWIQANTQSPASFGGSIPQFNSDAEKAAWIAANPAAYQAIGGAIPDVIGSDTQFISSEEKEAWIQNNAALYNPVVEQEAPSVIYMSQEEFNALPAEKQASVLSDSNFVILN